MITSGPEKRSFCGFKNEIKQIINNFDKRADELRQYYTEKEVNLKEIDQFLEENVLFKQKIWREVYAIEPSPECAIV